MPVTGLSELAIGGAVVAATCAAPSALLLWLGLYLVRQRATAKAQEERLARIEARLDEALGAAGLRATEVALGDAGLRAIDEALGDAGPGAVGTGDAGTGDAGTGDVAPGDLGPGDKASGASGEERRP
ncbi:MAG: hypothetical protein ACK2UL_10710 [Anaerolineae bacterium]